MDFQRSDTLFDCNVGRRGSKNEYKKCVSVLKRFE